MEKLYCSRQNKPNACPFTAEVFILKIDLQSKSPNKAKEYGTKETGDFSSSIGSSPFDYAL